MAITTQTYVMTCSCSDQLRIDADSREEAVGKLRNMMDEYTIETHFMEKHPGEPIPTVHEMHQMIEQNTMGQ